MIDLKKRRASARGGRHRWGRGCTASNKSRGRTRPAVGETQVRVRSGGSRAAWRAAGKAAPGGPGQTKGAAFGDSRAVRARCSVARAARIAAWVAGCVCRFCLIEITRARGPEKR
ncbi:hypothetical protein AQ824_22230 [Burkholderia pseudomallei]|nr:hypothetical protein AQ748_26845 [Burkholderia pseudomallei]OMU96959.1 hypothetical protein AQ784_00270 [Burkholderia pseudomallei]OMV10919.1 hypothetical protein AQ785_00835 [Burkholderia pseudomallei]OMW53470.1 hypothetical protein AQ812_00125 [Burkholderia pseudomallei]OMW70002.1 hypothetical protein AQ814_23910 [Burkholderia pseudomallei]